MYRKASPAAGFLIIAIYAVLGFGGLDHYAIAPLGAHSIAMNATIIGEVAAASVLVIFLAYSFHSWRMQFGYRQPR